MIAAIGKVSSAAAFTLTLGLSVMAGCGGSQAHVGRDGKPQPVPASQAAGGGMPASAVTDRGSSGAQKPPESAPDPNVKFERVTLDEARALLADPKTNIGLFVFVDARSQEEFEAGHLPDAIPCDYWHVGNRINAVMPRIQGAEKVIVYCQGKDCEVGLGLCRSLMRMAQVPRDNICLFEGGWEEWMAARLPVKTGPEEKP